MKYLFVPHTQAQALKQELVEKGILEQGPVLRELDRVGFPVKEVLEGYDLEERAFAPPNTFRSIREALVARIGDRANEIKRAFDIIGDIAILEATPGFEDVEREIGEALLEVHRNVKSVYIKQGAHEGAYRIQSYRWIAGDKRTITQHRENGYLLELDIATAYYSPRVAGERMRIARLVVPEENVLVLGSGVGPYAICIEKHSAAAHIVGVEYNEDAHRWAERNVERNRCARIECLRADARSYLSTSPRFDRIIMPLPAQSNELLPYAWKALAPGGSLHLYLFAKEDDLSAPPVKDLCGYRIEHIETVGAAAPGYYRICVDLRKD